MVLLACLIGCASEMTALDQGWQARWGDSPRRADGTFEWAVSEGSDGWTSTGSQGGLLDRGRQQWMWKRLRLPASFPDDACLYTMSLSLAAEVFVDGARVYRQGDPDSRSFDGFRPACIRLQPRWGGRWISFRFWSDDPRWIGLIGVVALGTADSMLAWELRQGLPIVGLSGVLVTSGLFSLGLWLWRRRERIYADFGAASLVFGIYYVFRSPHDWALAPPYLGLSIELSLLFLSAGLICRLFVTLLGGGPGNVMAWMGRGTFVFGLGATILMATGQVRNIDTMLPGQVVLLTACVVALAVALRSARRGSADARLAFAGLAGFIGFSIIDVVGSMNMTMGAVRWWWGASMPGVAIFFTSLGAILVRRFLAVHRSLEHQVRSLEERDRELSALNVELRRQVAERAKGFSEALAILSHQGPTAGLGPGSEVGVYRIERLLGTGGMGTVYEARRHADGSHIALKVMHEQIRVDAKARFAREAELAARVSHTNLVPVLDFGVSEQGRLYLVMEIVRGCTLAHIGERRRDRAWVSGVLAQVARGLAALHEAAIVHRDLKPSNVLLEGGVEGDGTRARIADFGIAALAGRIDEPAIDAAAAGVAATLVGDSGPRLTATGAVIGTPAYMAPELGRRGYEATPSADVFSFGVVSYEVLSGELPFRVPAMERRSTSPEIAASVWSRLGLDATIVDLLQQSLAFDPTRRPPARELAEALARFAGLDS